MEAKNGFSEAVLDLVGRYKLMAVSVCGSWRVLVGWRPLAEDCSDGDQIKVGLGYTANS